MPTSRRNRAISGPTVLLALLALSGATLHAQAAAAASTALPAPDTDASKPASVEAALLDILLEKGLITREEFDGLMALARERVAAEDRDLDLIEARLQRLTAQQSVEITGGAPGKLLFKSPDGRWSLGVKGLLQARLDVASSDDDSMDGSNYSVPNARLTFAGTAGAEHVTYALELQMSTQSTTSSSSTTTNFALRDAWINWGFNATNALRFGQFKFPFGREALVPESGLAFAARSIASNEFAPLFEPGAMVWGTASGGEWEYYLASSNGQGAGASNPAGSDQDGLRSGFRVVWNPLGPCAPAGSSFQTLDDGGTRASLGFAANRNADASGKTTVAPGTDTTTTDIEGQLLHGPWSLLTDFYNQEIDPQSGSNTSNSGMTVQLGWFVVPDTWELVARRSDIDFETAANQRQTSIGVNYYVDRQNGKWQLDLNRLDESGSSPDTTQLQLQYQLLF